MEGQKPVPNVASSKTMPSKGFGSLTSKSSDLSSGKRSKLVLQVSLLLFGPGAYISYVVSYGGAVWCTVPVLKDSGHDCLAGLSCGTLNVVSPLCGEIVCHGFSWSPTVPVEPSFEVLPPEVPGSGLLRSEDLLVLDREFQPVEVMSMGIEGVPWGAESPFMVELEWVDLAPLLESLSVGEVVRGIGVGIRGVRLIGELLWRRVDWLGSNSSIGMGYDHPGATQVGWYGFAVGIMYGDDLRFKAQVGGKKAWYVGWGHWLVPCS